VGLVHGDGCLRYLLVLRDGFLYCDVVGGLVAYMDGLPFQSGCMLGMKWLCSMVLSCAAVA
jgi:hypothetical protein